MKIAAGAAALVLAIVAGLWLVATWTPPPHPVHVAGATAVSVRSLPGWVPFRGGVLSPATSLDELRCATWKGWSSDPCPDATSLEERYWSGEVQRSATLYVPLAGGGYYGYSFPGGLNVEYDAAQSTIILHSYESRPLIAEGHADNTPGAALAASLVVLAISTAGFHSASVTVDEDNWIERLTGDESNGRSRLGVVALP